MRADGSEHASETNSARQQQREDEILSARNPSRYTVKELQGLIREYEAILCRQLSKDVELQERQRPRNSLISVRPQPNLQRLESSEHEDLKDFLLLDAHLFLPHCDRICEMEEYMVHNNCRNVLKIYWK